MIRGSYRIRTWLAVVALLFLAQAVFGQSNKTYYTATDQTTAALSAGTITTPDHNIHVRGAAVQTRITSTLFNGNMVVTLNANWDSTFCGPIWGTFVLTLDNGGVWEGTWTGKRTLGSGGWVATLSGDGYGTGAPIEGMHMKVFETAVSATPIPFPYMGSINGYIF